MNETAETVTKKRAIIAIPEDIQEEHKKRRGGRKPKQAKDTEQIEAAEPQPEPKPKRSGRRQATLSNKKVESTVKTTSIIAKTKSEHEETFAMEAMKGSKSRRGRKANVEVDIENKNPVEKEKNKTRQGRKGVTTEEPSFEQRTALRKSMVLTRAQRARLQVKN